MSYRQQVENLRYGRLKICATARRAKSRKIQPPRERRLIADWQRLQGLLT
jgi:hypothetical protein